VGCLESGYGRSFESSSGIGMRLCDERGMGMVSAQHQVNELWRTCSYVEHLYDMRPSHYRGPTFLLSSFSHQTLPLHYLPVKV